MVVLILYKFMFEVEKLIKTPIFLFIMGVLDFFKGLFAKEVPIEIEEKDLSLEAIPGFLDEKFTQQKATQDRIVELHRNIRVVIDETRDNLDALKIAKLRNPNIGVKAKQIMEGNRDSFIRRTQLFLDYLKHDPKEPSYENTQELCESFDEEVENYNKSTAKGFYVMQQFFANESRAVALNIKDLEKNVMQLNTIVAQQDLESKEKCVSLLEELKHRIQREQKFGLEQETLKHEKEKFQKAIDNYIRKRDKLKKSPGYAQFEKLQTEKEELVKDIKEKENYILLQFSPLKHAFKKFSRMSVDELFVEQYSEDALKAFLHDKDMKIVGVLANMRKALIDESLQLKVEKKQKALDAFDKLTPEFFSQWKLGYDTIRDKRLSKERLLRSNTVMQEYNELQYRVEHYQQKSEKCDEKIAKFEKDKEKLGISDLQKDLEKQLRNCTNVIVNVKL